ncbi:unnamed protein product [Microthlaspi erraticum]|uniref:RING-type E3 ubiquitin transferase n=1 Tax=Microthlaspi erraticum TaxID=1685480 RepID=A0A6D2HUY1_9BRAS|nr:unnamed protein product [Microthlaspi erraticum]
MVIEMNFLAGEASSSNRKRQRTLPSTVEVEEQGENGGRTASENRNVDDGDEVITEVRSGTMFDLDLLECPICCTALSAPIYQCDNGHIACSSCCIKLRHKCAACNLPIGNHRCRIMERVVEAIIVPCPNAKHGCSEKFSYGKELVHEKQCGFALCHCPALGCNYAGVSNDLYSHYAASHRRAWDYFTTFGRPRVIWLRLSEKILVLQEFGDGPLVAVQCFQEPNGVYVTVNCIAPCAPGFGEYSYRLSCSFGGKTVSFGLAEMNRIRRVSFETPEEDFMSVPAFFMAQRVGLKLELRISETDETEEEEEKAVETGEEDAAVTGEEEEEEAAGTGEVEAAETEEEEADETEVVDNVRRSTRKRVVSSKYQD